MTKTWGIIKEILGKRNHNSQPSISKLITQTDDAVTDKGKISNELNVFFTNIGSSLAAKIPAVTKAYLNNNSIRSQTNSIFFYPVTPKEVEKQFESLDDSKASGPESIPIKYIKIVGKIISPGGVRTGGGRGQPPPPIKDFKRNENLSFWNEPPFSYRDCRNCSHVFLCYPTCL